MISTLLLLRIIRNRRQRQLDIISFKERLTLEGKRRRDRRIGRRALQQPTMSAFAFVFGSGCDQSLITLTGFDFKSFQYILEKFDPVYRAYSPYSRNGRIRLLPDRLVKRGRPRSMTSAHCLGLVLTWGRSRGSEFVISLLFGITGSVCSLFLRFGRRVLMKVLKNDPNAEVRMPSGPELEGLKLAISGKYSLLQNVFCVADGLKLHLEQSGDSVIQNMFYNGWTHDHYVGNVFVFAPNGVIIACAINAPGSMHDSIIADWGGIYRKLREYYDTYGVYCVVDSAFSKGDFPFLIKSSQDPLMSSNGDGSLLAMLKQATSVRQASEWGMRALKGAFPRLKDRFIYEERGERRMCIMSLVYLFNLRTRLVGINQILSTYMPELSVEANHFLESTGLIQ